MRLMIKHGETEIEVEATPEDVEIGPGDLLDIGINDIIYRPGINDNDIGPGKEIIGPGENELIITNPLATLILEVVSPILLDIGISHPIKEVK